MADRQDLALRVDERGGDGFYWVLMEAHEPPQAFEATETSEGLHYRTVCMAHCPRSSYWEALILGMSELRRTMCDVSSGTERGHSGAAAGIG
jgi:hypothetical protein